MPNTLAIPGMMTPYIGIYENPILLSIRKRGSIVTCTGMTIDRSGA